MREIALNILDIAENSVKANSKLVEIDVVAADDLLTVSIVDDGTGMDKKFLARVTDPFTTTRTTRKVGMGIPLFKMASEMAGGQFEISSEKGVGTSVKATFQINHIDRAPLGDVADTMVTLLSSEKDTDFRLHIAVDNNTFDFDTRELKAELGGIPVDTPEILVFVRDMIKDNIINIGGAKL